MTSCMSWLSDLSARDVEGIFVLAFIFCAILGFVFGRAVARRGDDR